MGSGVEYAFHCNRHRGYEWILKCLGMKKEGAEFFVWKKL